MLWSNWKKECVLRYQKLWFLFQDTSKRQRGAIKTLFVSSEPPPPPHTHTHTHTLSWSRRTKSHWQRLLGLNDKWAKSEFETSDKQANRFECRWVPRCVSVGVEIVAVCACVVSVCVLCRGRVDGVNITAAMCLFPRVLVCGVSVISPGLNTHFPSIYSLYVCPCVYSTVWMHVCCKDINVSERVCVYSWMRPTVSSVWLASH